MGLRCIHCGQHDLEKKLIQLEGIVRAERYQVEMMGLVCPACGYKTIEGVDMPEYGRLLADKYRANHGLLTSVDIRNRRAQFEMNQEEFARFLGVGIASVKRWELGKIQDKRNNDLIIEKTTPKVRSLQDYRFSGCGQTIHFVANYELGSATFVNAFVANQEALPQIKIYLDGVLQALPCRPCKRTGEASIDLISPENRTLSPYLAKLFMQLSHLKEEYNDA